MSEFSKRAAIATLLTGLASPALGACIVAGDQATPPHKDDSFSFEYRFSGGPLDTLRQCLHESFNNEEIQGRDVTHNSMQYSSSARGNFNMTGYAAQPGDDLSLAHRPFNSVAIGVISGASGVNGLTNGNIVELAPGSPRVTVYQDWANFKQTSPHAALFDRRL